MDTESLKHVITLPDGTGKKAVERGCIVFTNGGSIADGLIRIGQGFRGYTHCGIARGDGKMVASFADFGGVSLQDDLQQITTEIRRWNHGFTDDYMIERAESHLGAKYDYGGLLAAIHFPTWGGGPPKSFTCSSFLAYLVHGNLPNVRGVTPDFLWNLMK